MRHLQEKEKYIIGAILLKNSLFPKILLSHDDFYDEKLKEIYRRMRELFLESREFTMLDFPEYLVECASAMNVVSVPEIAIDYAKEVKKLSRERNIFLSASGIVDAFNADENIDIPLQKLQSSLHDKTTKGKDGRELVESFLQEQADISQKIENGQEYIGMSCGIEKIDRATDGIRAGHLWIIGGYTNTGKSFLALNISKKLLEQKKRVLFYSLEMSTEEIGDRLIGLFSGVNGTLAKKGRLGVADIELIEGAKEKLYHSNITVFDSERSFDDIRYSILGENANEKVDCVFIDYMQLLNGRRGETQYETLRRASYELQTLGKSTGIPIIALSQISNESARSDSEVAGYKGSGDIAASADVGLEIRTDEPTIEILREKQSNHQPVDMILHTRKNRHGFKPSVKLSFFGQSGVFSERY